MTLTMIDTSPPNLILSSSSSLWFGGLTYSHRENSNDTRKEEPVLREL